MYFTYGKYIFLSKFSKNFVYIPFFQLKNTCTVILNTFLFQLFQFINFMYFTYGKYICYQHFHKSLYIFLYFQLQNTCIVIINTFLCFRGFNLYIFLCILHMENTFVIKIFKKFCIYSFFSNAKYMHCHYKYIFEFQWFQFINFVMYFTYGKYICYQNFQKILHLFLFSIKIYMYCRSKYIFVLVVSIYKFCYVFYIWKIHLLSKFSRNFKYIFLYFQMQYTCIVILNTFLFQLFQFINFVMYFTYGIYICYHNFHKILYIFLYFQMLNTCIIS